MLYNKPHFPEVADITHATEKAAAFFHSFFTVKSQHDIGATMEHFSQEKLTYIDAILGWLFDSHGVLIYSPCLEKQILSDCCYPGRNIRHCSARVSISALII